jgi:hypothetical protein
MSPRHQLRELLIFPTCHSLETQQLFELHSVAVSNSHSDTT